MKEINIPCDSTIKVQSSLDFYLGITSIGNINSLKELRKSMFDKFMSEYKDMNYPLIDLNSFTALSEEGNEDIKEEQTEEVSEGHTSATNFLQMLQHMREAPTPNIDDSDESEEEEGEYITPEVVEEENEEEHLELEVEEEPLEEDISEESEEAEEVDIEDGREYVSHGIYIEDLIDGTISIPTIDYEDEDSEIEEVEDIDWEEEENEESDWNNEGTENIDWDEEDEQEDSLGDIFLPEDEEEEIEEPISQKEDDSESWFSEESEQEESVSYSSEPVQSIKREVSIEDDGPGADVPPDIRVFLKQHPNSDMSYVLKFYPKKEVDKQLKLGRIYKRKGKLMI